MVLVHFGELPHKIFKKVYPFSEVSMRTTSFVDYPRFDSTVRGFVIYSVATYIYYYGSQTVSSDSTL